MTNLVALGSEIVPTILFTPTDLNLSEKFTLMFDSDQMYIQKFIDLVHHF